jgi:hypothetical protein
MTATLAPYSRRYRIGSDGSITFSDSRGTFAVHVGGLEVGFAARAIADAFVDAGRLDDPQVTVTSADGWAAGGAGSAKGGIGGKLAPFEACIRTVTEPIDALVRYREWLRGVKDPHELDAITPPHLWALALKKPSGSPRDPRDAHIDEYIELIKHQQELDAQVNDPKERSRRVRTMSRFLSSLARNKESRGFLRMRPAIIYADLSVQVLKEDVTAQVKIDVAAQREAAERKRRDDPEVAKAREEQWDKFYELALQLWGYSSRKFPYLIQLPGEGRDILVTGDPALQAVLNDLAGDLLQWATGHAFDSDYTSKDPRWVLLDLKSRGRYHARFDAASRNPLEHESIQRNDILWGRVLESFGETVGTGSLVIGVVGLFVGAEVITAGQAIWLLVGVAGYSGASSYVTRRDEIEQKGYDVPIPRDDDSLRRGHRRCEPAHRGHHRPAPGNRGDAREPAALRPARDRCRQRRYRADRLQGIPAGPIARREVPRTEARKPPLRPERERRGRKDPGHADAGHAEAERPTRSGRAFDAGWAARQPQARLRQVDR